MTLLETWRNMAYSQELTKKQSEDLWADYFVKEKKIYPNDPCPCGSGKKYKKCCGKQ